jgi:RNA polymerase sigma-70 factor, ECF subfamily
VPRGEEGRKGYHKDTRSFPNHPSASPGRSSFKLCTTMRPTRQSAPPSDRTFLEQFIGGDQDAFREIVERYQRRVLAYVSRYIRPVYRAEDVTQETFFRLFRLIKRKPNIWPEGDSLEPLVVAIAGRTATDDLRREGRRRSAHDAMAIFPREEPPQADADAIAAEINDEIHAALAKLPSTLRRTALLYFLEGQSRTEVAKVTRSKLDTVTKRINRARELLITFLLPYWKEPTHDVRRAITERRAREATDGTVPGIH